ncbi:hypothetical protein [Tenacibaculum holothuriorum]|nr:hypothetical protein [Tenacibaculum holothuriorum]
MKKLLFNLFLLVSTLSLVSCSGNDDDVSSGNKNELKVVIDGKEEVFNTIVVNKNAQNPFGTNEVVQLTATINSSTAKVITFLLEKGAVGNNTLGVFTYTDNG